MKQLTIQLKVIFIMASHLQKRFTEELQSARQKRIEGYIESILSNIQSGRPINRFYFTFDSFEEAKVVADEFTLRGLRTKVVAMNAMEFSAKVYLTDRSAFHAEKAAVVKASKVKPASTSTGNFGLSELFQDPLIRTLLETVTNAIKPIAAPIPKVEPADSKSTPAPPPKSVTLAEVERKAERILSSPESIAYPPAPVSAPPAMKVESTNSTNEGPTPIINFVGDLFKYAQHLGRHPETEIPYGEIGRAINALSGAVPSASPIPQFAPSSPTPTPRPVGLDFGQLLQAILRPPTVPGPSPKVD